MMKRAIVSASLIAAMLVLAACQEDETDCKATACPSCKICDAGQTSDDLVPVPCEDFLRPTWECVALEDCTSPRDLNLFARAWFDCPESLPVCCARNFFPPPKELDAGADSGN